MALEKRIKPSSKDRQIAHEETECLASTFTDSAGQTYLQLDTLGSAQRKFSGKVSQSIQFNSEGAAELKRLINRAFPHL